MCGGPLGPRKLPAFDELAAPVGAVFRGAPPIVGPGATGSEVDADPGKGRVSGGE